jgi:hypothetical protein
LPFLVFLRDKETCEEKELGKSRGLELARKVFKEVLAKSDQNKVPKEEEEEEGT